ncbi:hypothetical protein [Halovalidus salilacus]|uniref:hypothetical protein n=1 Tax=Halovalidus salilacus TaxID=3075124 RepID=UPI00387DD254
MGNLLSPVGRRDCQAIRRERPSHRKWIGEVRLTASRYSDSLATAVTIDAESRIRRFRTPAAVTDLDTVASGLRSSGSPESHHNNHYVTAVYYDHLRVTPLALGYRPLDPTHDPWTTTERSADASRSEPSS